MPMHSGWDISSNNAGLRQVDFNAAYQFFLAAGGGAMPLCIVKVNQGTGYLNPTLATYVAMARAAGFICAGYLMDQGDADPAAEEALYEQTTDLPQADDVELPEGLSTAQYIAHAGALINVHPNELDYLNQSEVAEGFPQGWGLWLAQYNGVPGDTVYACDLHQYTSSGTIPGINGTFDFNAWVGSETRFQQFFRLIATPIPSTQEADTDMRISKLLFNPPKLPGQNMTAVINDSNDCYIKTVTLGEVGNANVRITVDTGGAIKFSSCVLYEWFGQACLELVGVGPAPGQPGLVYRLQSTDGLHWGAASVYA